MTTNTSQSGGIAAGEARGAGSEITQPPTWPDGKAVAVSLTFDVDAESALLGRGLDEDSNQSSFSERQFGITRGLGRILRLLGELDVRGTFYVPGYTAEKYPDAILEIAKSGHEVAHHGYLHRAPNEADLVGQREELERGIAALTSLIGSRPDGYRSPSWELTSDTFHLLAEYGFSYDSSCMGDDRPYVAQIGETALLELPVHWSLDDWPYYSWKDGRAGLMSVPRHVLDVWLAELGQARTEGGHVTYTMHPEVTGRRSRFAMLRSLLETLLARGDVWFGTHRQVADLVGAPRHN